jgi:hypothetical protein
MNLFHKINFYPLAVKWPPVPLICIVRLKIPTCILKVTDLYPAAPRLVT